MLLMTTLAWFTSCSDNLEGSRGFNPDSPIEVTNFYPDSGGIATPVIIEGHNFGADTTGLKVYFEDVDGIKHQAGLISSNGNRIYVVVPKGLTYKREMNILVGREMNDGKEYIGKAEDQFMYKTQTSVTTIVGQADPGNTAVRTTGGELTSSTLSSPYYICLDDEDNIFVVNRPGNSGADRQPNQYCYDEKGTRYNGIITMASEEANSVIVLQKGAYMNAPAFSNEENNEAVYIPEDEGMGYYNLSKLLSYAPRRQIVLKSEETSTIDTKNWKHCFVVNKNDHQIYTVMQKGQLVRINPQNRTCEILLTKVGAIPGSSDAYVAFSPVKGQEDILYITLASYHQILRLNVRNLTPEMKDTYTGEPYAGKAITEGRVAGRGWEDGLLKNAKFDYPRQICFTDDGKLYIADSGNSCIRVIDTVLPKDKATVTTPIGLPRMNGYQDGGPEIAKFYYPCGVAVNKDGTNVYVADTQNKVIRKLSIE